jgi:hypothetical protein
LQLDELSKEITQNQNTLETKRREIAHVKGYIAAQHAQQETLDALALRFETDCLKAEDRLHVLKNIEESINNDYAQWNLTEHERNEVTNRAKQQGKNQSQEMAELHRQLGAVSMEAAAAKQASSLQQSNIITANVQVENVRKALSAAQEEAAVLRRRLDETELALAERTAALKMETRSAKIADGELMKVLKQVENAKEGLDAETTAGKELSKATADAEKRLVEVKKRAKVAQSSLNDAQQSQKLAEMELRHQILASKQAEAAAQGTLAQAGHSARLLAASLQKHRELEEAIEAQENVGRSSREHHSAFVSHVEGMKKTNAALDEKIAELSKEKIRLQQERELLKEKGLDRQNALSNTQAQSKVVDSKANRLREQLQHHEGALYRVDFQLLMAKRAATLATAEGAAETSTHNQSPESLSLLKQELQSELENAHIAQRKQVRSVWEVEAASQQVGAAADGLHKEINTISEQQKIEEVALKTAKNSLQASRLAKEDAQMAVDRAEMSLARSQQRFTDKAREVLQLSAAVEQNEISFQTQASELENKLQELSIDHHAAVKTLQASKSALSTGNVAVFTAAATLSTLQLKTQQDSRTDKEKKTIPSCSAAASAATALGEGGVANVCAEMQRQVQELQSALAAAEADCDVLEHALTAQKQATATANHHYS